MTEIPPPSLLPVTPTPGSNDTGGLAENERLRKVNVDAGKLITRLKQELGEKDRAIARVQQANDDMRTWCSPYGFVEHCADHIDKALAKPEGDHRD